MICDNCGHINPNINKRCDKCGKQLEPAPRYPTERNKSTNRTYDKNEGLFDDIKNLSTEKKIIGVCCFILLIIFAVSSVLPYNNDSTVIPYDNNTTDYVTDVNNSPEVVQTPTKVNTNINVSAKSPVKSGESTTIKGYLLDESENPLYNCEVIIKIASNEFKVKSKHDGSYTFEYNDTENGSQNVMVIFEETSNYYGCYNNTFIEVVNNTTDDLNNTNNTTRYHSTQDNHTDNNTKNISDDEHDNHDTHNSILSWILGHDSKQENNLTGNHTTDNSTTNSSTHNNTNDNTHANNTTTANNHNTTNNDKQNNNTDDHENNSSNTSTRNNITNTIYHNVNSNNTTDDKNDTIKNTVDNENNNTTTTNDHNNTTTDDKKEDDHHHTENNTTQENDTNKNGTDRTTESKSDTKLDVKIENNITENMPTEIRGTLVDENNTPIANAVIKIKIDGKEVITHTDNHGEYSIEYTPTDDKTKDVEVIYEGDDSYSSVHKSDTMSIK